MSIRQRLSRLEERGAGQESRIVYHVLMTMPNGTTMNATTGKPATEEEVTHAYQVRFPTATDER